MSDDPMARLMWLAVQLQIMQMIKANVVKPSKVPKKEKKNGGSSDNT